MSTPQPEIPAALHLGPSLDVYGGEQIRQALLEHLSKSTKMVLDLGAVEACDVAGIQLLCSARRAALEAGKAFHLEHIPQVVTDCCTRLGLPLESLTGSAA